MAQPNIEGFVGERLSLARDARNITQGQIAEALGVVTPTISRWERGERKPGGEQLTKLADALGVHRPYFLKPVADYGDAPIFFRSLASATVKARTKERAKMRWLQHISATLQNELEFPPVDIQAAICPTDYSRLADSDIEQIAADLRKRWRLGEGPINNMVLLAENAGVVVGIDEVGSTTIDGQANWCGADDRPYILLARDKNNAFRRQMDLAHEIAHLTLHRGVTRAQLETDFELIEHQAKYFAGAFLLPPHSFAAEIPSLSLDGFLSLKKRWKVALGAMIMRAEQLGVLSEAGAQRLWKYRAARGWAKREPLDDPKDTPISEPRFLGRCFDLIIEAGRKKRRDLLETDIGLGAADVEMLASLSPGYFGEQQAEIVRLEPKLRASPSNDTTADVIPFKRAT